MDSPGDGSTFGYRNPTLAQVAKLAGVSPATASNVLNGTGRPSQQTIARVRRVAQLLRYEANVSAQALRTGDVLPLVAVVVDEESALSAGSSEVLPPHTYWYRVLFGVWSALWEQGVGVLTVTAERLDLLARVPVAVLLYTSTQGERPDFSFLGSRTPVIVGGPSQSNDQAQIRGHINYDFERSTRQALDYLAERGSREIMLVHGADVPWIQAVRQAYVTWCAQQEIEPRQVDGTKEVAETTAQIAAALGAGCDGIFDLTAWTGASLMAVAESGKTVPGEVQIIAHLDDGTVIPNAPDFTVITPDAFNAAATTARVIMELIAAPDESVSVVLDSAIVKGQTTRES